MDTYFVPENEIAKAGTYTSDSGKYKLEVFQYKTREGCWHYSLGRIFKDNNKLMEVKRNYHSFPFSWAENHPNGHDYLICGEDYQGQTIIELDTGKRKDYLPVDAYNGMGFCWAEHHPSPDNKRLAIIGCFWACPYELIIYDFSDPMNLPYKELSVADAPAEFEWIDNETAKLTNEVTRRKSDGKPFDDLTREEEDAAIDADDFEDIKVSKEVKI